MKFLNKIAQALGITKAPVKEQKTLAKEERMPTGGSKYTPSTDTPQKRKKKRLNKLANKARNLQHRLAA